MFDTNTIDAALAQVNAYKKALRQRAVVNEIMEELARIGVQVVDYQYSTVDNDCTVGYKKQGKNYVVVAEGYDVMFVEFGTGVMTSESTASQMDAAWVSQFVQPGMWSQTEGAGHFIPGEHEYWYYEGKKYEGTPATNGMYYATKEMKKEVERIVRKALKKL